MAEEGVAFRPGVWVGRDADPEELASTYDAVLLACGATSPRDLPAPGRELAGVHFAMEFLKANTKHLLDGEHNNGSFISAADKDVIVIGGGDTGADCIGTAVRHRAKSIRNFELLPKPPAERNESMPWPTFARIYKLDYSHQETAAFQGEDPRVYSVMTKEFLGNGKLEGVRTVNVKWEKSPGERPKPVEIPGSEQEWAADIVLLSMGFLGPEQDLLETMGLEADPRSNIAAAFEDHRTSREGVFAAGDARRGQSLVVWAIKEGRTAAREIDRYLMGETVLT
jgi:NADPH-dependent glutamate synthase beta subunit-like oxidoreductase